MSSDPAATPPIARQGVLVPLTTFASIGFVCFVLFSLVRTRFKDIYSPRRGLDRCRPPKIPPGMFSWVRIVYKTPESFLISTVGLDGVMLLRFFKMGMQLFGLLTLLGMSTLAPVNYFAAVDRRIPSSPSSSPASNYSSSLGTGGPGDISINITNQELDFLYRITIQNVPPRSSWLSFHLLYLWVISIIGYACLIIYYRDYVNLKFQYQEHVLRKSRLSKIEMRSLMVYGIPRDLRNESALAAYFQSLGLGRVENVVICRKWSNLKKAVYQRAKYLMLLEEVFSKVMRLANRKRVFLFHRGRSGTPGSNVVGGINFSDSHTRNSTNNTTNPTTATTSTNALMLASSRFVAEDSSTDTSIFEIMSRLDAVDPKFRPKHRLGLLGLFGQQVDSADFYSARFKEWDKKVTHLRRASETSPSTSVGFVTFESPESALIASQVNIASQPFACMTRLAPEPRDLFWPNISSRTADPYIKLFRSTFVLFSLIMMVFFSLVAVSAIASLFDLKSIKRIFPALSSFIDSLPDFARRFIEGVIATAILSLWNSSLPSLLLLLSQMQGLEARSWIEMSVLSKYFFYQLWNILFVLVSSTVWQNVKTPRDVVEIIGDSLPVFSPTLINYTMLQAFASYPAQLLLVGPLLLTWITRMTQFRSTPRLDSDIYYPSVLTSMNYGYSYPVPILIWVIGMIYAPIAPIVSAFCCFFFGVAYMVNKYMLLYVHIPQYETGGMQTPMAVRRCLIGMLIMQATMMCVLAMKYATPIASPLSLSSSSSAIIMLVTKFKDDVAAAQWTGYVSMIVNAMPLLFLTMGLFYWFRQGYEVEVKHIPLDLMARIGRDVSKEVQDLDLATCSASAGADQPSFSLSGPIFSRTSNKQHHRLSSEEIGGGAGAGKGKGKELVSFSTPPKSQSLAIIGSSSSNSNIVKDTLEPITSSSPSSPTSSCSSPHVGDGGSNYNKLIPRKPSSRSLNIRETLRGNIKDSIKKRSSSSTLASKASFTGLELTDTLRTSSRQEGVVAGEVVEVDESVSSSPIASKSSLPLSINNNANDNAVAPVSGIGGASPPTPFSKRFLLFPDKRLNEGEVESGGHGKSNKNRRFSMLHTFANVTTTPRDANLFEVPTSAEDEENEKTSTSVGGRAVDELEEEDDLRPAVSPYPIPSPRHVDIEAQHDDHLSYTNPSSPTHPLSAGVHYLPTPVQRGILNSYYAETDQNIVTSKAMHLEPPMTRVPGILDVPLESSIPIIPDLDEEDFMMQEEGSDVTDEHQLMVGGPPASSTSSGVGRKYVRFPALTKKQPLDMDLTLYTYLHPALIGRLPIAWLASTSRSGGEGSSNSTVEENSRQPRRLVEAREEQKQLQADFKRKLTERVRLGAVYAAAASGVRCEEVEEEDEEDDEGSSGEDQEDEEEVLLVEEDGAELTQTESDPLLGATSGDGGGGSSTTTGAANQTRDKQSRKKKRSPRTRRRTRRNRNNHRSIDVLFTSRVRSFFDGLTSWAHLQLS